MPDVYRISAGKVSATVELNRGILAQEFHPIGVRLVRQLGGEVEREAKRIAPVRTGRLRDSIHANDPRWLGTMLVAAPVTAYAPHARYVHEGTRPHVIRARRAQALHFYWEKVGREVFFASVHHPGTRAQPFLLIAARRVAARHR